MMNHAEAIAGLGSWEWTPESGETNWSDNLFRMLGLEPGEIDPSVEYVLTRIHSDDRRHVQGALTALQGGGCDSCDEYGLEYRIFRTEGTLRYHRVAVDIVGDAPRRIIGSVQDVTLQRRLDRKLAAHIAVTQALEDWRSLEQGAERLLGQMAAAMDFGLGVFWLPDGPTLGAKTIWYAPSAALGGWCFSCRRRGSVRLSS